MDSAFLFNFQYPSIDLILDYDIARLSKKLLLAGALKINYLPNSIPFYPFRDYMSCSLELKIKYHKLKL